MIGVGGVKLINSEKYDFIFEKYDFMVEQYDFMFEQYYFVFEQYDFIFEQWLHSLTILHYFTDKSIKCTCWPGILPLQGSPTGNKKDVLQFFTICYTLLHDLTEKSITCTFWSGILPLQGSPTGKNKR